MYKYVKDNSDAILIAITNPTKKNKNYEADNSYYRSPHNDKMAEYVRNHSLPDYIIDVNKELEDDEWFDSDNIHLKSGQNWIVNKLKEIIK